MRLSQVKSTVVLQAKEPASPGFRRSADSERFLDYHFGGKPFSVLPGAYEVRGGKATEVYAPPLSDLVRANASLERPKV